MARYSGTTYLENEFATFGGGFGAAMDVVAGGNGTAAFNFGGVTVVVDKDSRLEQSKKDWRIAVVMGMREIFKPLQDVALINEANSRLGDVDASTSMTNCFLHFSTLSGSIAVEGFARNDIHLQAYVHIWLRDNRGLTDEECVEILKGTASYAVLTKAFPPDAPYLPFLVNESKWCGAWNGKYMQEMISILSK